MVALRWGADLGRDSPDLMDWVGLLLTKEPPPAILAPAPPPEEASPTAPPSSPSLRLRSRSQLDSEPASDEVSSSGSAAVA